MAYVFQNIMGQLGQDKDQQSQTNIFAEGQGSQDPSQGGEGASPGQQPKTSTEGDLSGAGGGTGTAAEGLPNDIRKQDSRALKRNIGKVSTPDFTNRIKNDLTTADQKLQQEADSYMSTAKTDADGYKLDDAALDKAVAGDMDAQTRIKSGITAEKRDYEDFIPQTKTEYEDVTNLGSSQGLNALLGKEARGQLSGREIAFDRSVLERSPEFIAIREALQGQQSALSEKAGGYKENKTTEAQKLIDESIKGAKDFATTGLQTRDKTLREMNQSEADAINAERKKMRESGVPQEAIDRILGIKGQLAAEFDDTMRLDDLINSSDVDASKFLTFADDVGMNDMVDENEAIRFNNIMMLLGNGGQSVIAGKGAGDAYTLDERGVRDYVTGDAQNRRVGLDTDLMSERDQILAAIKERIGGENSLRSNQYDAYKKAVIDDLRRQYEGNNNGYKFSNLNLDQFFSGPGQVGFDDLVSENDASRLNEIAKSLGSQETYKAGKKDISKADMAAIQRYLDEQSKLGFDGKPTSKRERNTLDEINQFFVDTQPKNAITSSLEPVSTGAGAVQSYGEKSKAAIAKKNPLSKKNRRY
jgi:hypothetical protein